MAPPQEDLPTRFAHAQAQARSAADDAALRRAIAELEDVRNELTSDSDPRLQAAVMHELAWAFERRGDARRAADCHRDLLRVWRPEWDHMAWARTQHALGRALLAAGASRAEVKEAIACFEAALGVLARDRVPDEWALAQIGLGQALLGRAGAQRAVSVERAIGCLQQALEALKGSPPRALALVRLLLVVLC